MDGVAHDTLMCDAEALGLTSQRRLVTVLFADLSGYSALSETLDPEDVQALLGRVFGEAAQVIARYGGHIDKFIGDAVMALFGLPESHEDDALRCVAAAREIHEVVSALGSPAPGLPILSMHSGIETGIVVSGQVHDNGSDRTVLGDVVNVAARLVPLAGRNEIVVGPQTHALTCGSFDFADLGEKTVRGRNGRVHLFRLAGPKARPSRVHGAGTYMPALFGREREMGELREAVDRATVGKSSLVLIRGDAGTGKSRLVEELRASRPPGVRWECGYCYEYTSEFPFSPVVDLLSRAWGITDRDSPDELRAKIDVAATRRVGSERPEAAARLARLWGLESPELRGLDPESWRSQLPLDIGAVLGSLANEGPTVLAMEDLHWADSSSLEIVSSLLKAAVPGVVFLCTARPPFEFAEREAFAERLGYMQLDLEELSDKDARSMIASMLETDEPPAGLRSSVIEQAGGNPFYLQELVTSLVHSGAIQHTDDHWEVRTELSDVTIPAGVREMIAARLDALSDEERLVLRNAAVLGQVFSRDVLEAVVDDEADTRRCLRALARAGVLVPFSEDRVRSGTRWCRRPCTTASFGRGAETCTSARPA